MRKRIIVTTISYAREGRDLKVEMACKWKGKRHVVEETKSMEENEIVPKMMVRLYYRLKKECIK